MHFYGNEKLVSKIEERELVIVYLTKENMFMILKRLPANTLTADYKEAKVTDTNSYTSG